MKFKWCSFFFIFPDFSQMFLWKAFWLVGWFNNDLKQYQVTETMPEISVGTGLLLVQIGFLVFKNLLAILCGKRISFLINPRVLRPFL